MNTNSIERIKPLWDTLPTVLNENKRAENNDQAIFASIFQSAIDNVKETDATKNEAEYLLATGQLDNPADLTIASTKAELSVALLVQLRNRALDSYNNLINMSL